MDSGTPAARSRCERSQRGGAAAAGGFTVNIIRLMGKWLSERLGQEFVIENRSGATMNIATDVAVRAPSDGYRARRHRHLNGRIP
jgi:Tripartite tricarboxylate transporter family receptor